ncbi:MAG TPA: sigma-70 family RNA polymerase sigma factor [bacterium]|nr:sigma-70 family RNA polymerase sigma factor [bacterium]
MPLLNPTDGPTDEAILAGSLHGEPELFAKLVVRYERRVFGLLLRQGVDAAAREDVYQQVWLRAWSGRAGFQGRSKFSTWLYAIVLNEVGTWRRKRRDLLPLDQVPEPVQKGPGVLDRLLGRARQEALDAELAHLNPRDREALNLRHQQGLNYAEIGALTGTTAGQARMRAFRALKRLTEKLQGRGL